MIRHVTQGAVGCVQGDSLVDRVPARGKVQGLGGTVRAYLRATGVQLEQEAVAHQAGGVLVTVTRYKSTRLCWAQRKQEATDNGRVAA